MPTIVTETEFQKFRGKLHNQFKNLADSAMEMLDALCSNNKTASVVRLSLNPLLMLRRSLKRFQRLPFQVRLLQSLDI
jgi:hypothetical protein